VSCTTTSVYRFLCNKIEFLLKAAAVKKLYRINNRGWKGDGEFIGKLYIIIDKEINKRLI
jgi:hypothetical protein